jgi:hypothetical protein
MLSLVLSKSFGVPRIRAGGMAHMVESLPSKYKTLSSSCSTSRRKEGREEGRKKKNTARHC